MNSEFIPLSVPVLRGNEQRYVADAIAKEWVSTGGEYIRTFEKQFAEYAKTDTAVACQSGTAGLHLSLLECGVGRGDLVIAPALTFIASINPIRYVGADPVFMDCDDSICMDMIKLEEYLREECEFHKDTLYDKQLHRPIAAIIVVHTFGNSADMDTLMSLAEEFRLPVIEDAAEAVGTFYRNGKFAGKMAGTIGDFGVYSFNGNKVMTTGGGGMLVAKDKKKLAHAKHLSTQARTDDVHYSHDAIGYNYRMTNIQAAVGVAQLEQLDRFIDTKETNYRRYIESGIALLPFGRYVRPNYWFYCHQTENRDGLIQFLAERRIQSRPIWMLNNLHDMYRNCRAYNIENAARYRATVVNIPCSANLTNDDITRVATTIKRYEGSLQR